MNTTDWLNSLRNRFQFKIISCVLLAGTADYLFYDHKVGWTLGLFMALLLGAYALFNHRALSKTGSQILTALMLGLSVALVLNPNATAIFLLILGFIGLALQRGYWPGQAFLWLKNAFVYAITGWLTPWIDMGGCLKTQSKRSKRAWQITRWILPVCLSVVFIVLFAQANPIIDKWFTQFDWERFWTVFTPRRVIYFQFILLSAWALIRRPFINIGVKRPIQTILNETDIPPKSVFLPEIIKNCLILFNVIFLAQNGMDIVYLWGGLKLPDGLTYAEYAHRGAYPLIFTALLAGAFVLLTLKPGSTTEHFPGIKPLVMIWIGQNVLLTLSSIWRTLLYVEAYSLTHLRVAAIIWMGLVAAGLVWMMLRIVQRKSNRWLININAATLLLVLYGCSFADFNSIIAWYNVRHSEAVIEQGAALDLNYFQDILGPSAIPALDWYLRNAKPAYYAPDDVIQIRHNLISEFYASTIRQPNPYLIDDEPATQEIEQKSKPDWREWTWKNQQLEIYIQKHQL